MLHLNPISRQHNILKVKLSYQDLKQCINECNLTKEEEVEWEKINTSFQSFLYALSTIGATQTSLKEE